MTLRTYPKTPSPSGRGLLLSLSLWERAGVREEGSGAASPLTLTLSPASGERGIGFSDRS